MAISYIQANGKDIAVLVDRIEDAIEGNPNAYVSIACIIVAILAQNPELSAERLQECVQTTSEYLAALLFNESASGAVN